MVVGGVGGEGKRALSWIQGFREVKFGRFLPSRAKYCGSFSFPPPRPPPPPPPPHLTYTSILCCNEGFYKVKYEDQICLSALFQFPPPLC